MDVLPDVLAPCLDLVICGSAAGTMSAATKTYYAHPQNRFWKTLFTVQLTPRLLQPQEYYLLLEFGIGLTDMAKRAKGMDSHLVSGAYDPRSFETKMLQHKPKVICFNGKNPTSAYLKYRRALTETEKLTYGRQCVTLGEAILFVAPSTSPAAMTSWRPECWLELADLVRLVSTR